MKEINFHFFEEPNKGPSGGGLDTSVNSGVNTSVNAGVDTSVGAGVDTGVNISTVNSKSSLTPKQEAAVYGKK